MKELLKQIEKLYKSASPEDKAYAEALEKWLLNWLKPKPGGPQPADDPGDHPPPPPPHK